jgi:thioredoxin reductase (NADPH)
MSESSTVISTEVVIIGAGPCGLFQVFELGLLGIKAHVLDSLAHPGGQCTELYPEKPIYDIPALPVCGAQELIDRLMEQIKPFHAEFHLSAEVTTVKRQKNSTRFEVRTANGLHFDTGAVIIAGGVGSFQPRRLVLPEAAALEGSQVHYRVKRADDFASSRLLILGGGDSALDWALHFSEHTQVALVHRRAEFRAAPSSVTQMKDKVAKQQMAFYEGLVEGLDVVEGRLQAARIKQADGSVVRVECDHILAFYGLHPKLGPIAEWGLALERKALPVDTEKFQTSEPGIFAVGDINTYPGKKKLILSGFHEAALAAFGVQGYLYPERKSLLQYTTTSPAMQKRLGVSA